MKTIIARAAAVLALILLAAACGSSLPSPAADAGPIAGRPGHVFIIVLENQDYETTFGAAPGSPYLARTLTSMGALLTQYYGTGHASLDNYISMVSGQAPNAVTQADCAYYADFVGTAAVDSGDGQAVGQGCVYPPEIKTIGTQLTDAGRTWKQYGEDMALGPASGLPATCRHPAINAQDTSQGSSATDQYATRHVPFVYFHSIIDDQAYCDAHVVDLAVLDADLAAVATTPNLAFITPDVCSDGHDAACANTAQQGGYAGIEEFLKVWIPKLMASPAFQQDGMIIVTFDEAEASTADACCDEPTGPNTPMPGITGMGGGRTGAVVISPFVRAGTVSDVPYNHYSLLRSLEDLFGLEHLGYAAQDGLVPFGADVYSAR